MRRCRGHGSINDQIPAKEEDRGLPAIEAAHLEGQ